MNICSVMMWVYLLLLCFTTTLGCRSVNKKDFFSKSGWGSWNPANNSWEDWVKIWGTENSSVAFDSTEEGRDPASGWPSYWKGMGKGNSGVPPPPWAYVPKQYGRPSFCYLKPESGKCTEKLIRWAFDPTPNLCVSFEYSGCGGNENNFMQKYDCMDACGHVPSTGCDSGLIAFKKYIVD